MVSLIKKMKKGCPYWYLVKSARINGKPRIVWQKYLGSAEKIEEIINKSVESSIYSKSFGSISAMLSIAEELNLKEIISNIVPDNNYKLSVYQHIIMQSICRFNKPMSRKASIKWFKNSILPLLWKKDFQSPQTIFNQFDKNIINLGLVVSEDNIPLMHVVYDGNKKESDVIIDITNLIHSRLNKLNFDIGNMVFVFDKGNNSKENIPKIKEKFHFVGSLRMNQMSNLLDIPLSKFEDLYTNKKGNLMRGYKTREKIYGEEYSIVVTYNEKGERKQREKTDSSIKKITEKFQEIENSFNKEKKGKKTKIKGLSSRINDFLHRQYRTLFDWTFDEKDQKFSWSFNKDNFELRKKMWGKNILFSDSEKLTTRKIAEIYNSKTIIEHDFKSMKDKLLIPIKPFNLRKDRRLKAHIFICVLSMILYRYMIWKLKDLKLSENRLNEELKSMRIAFVKQEGSNSVKKVLENMTPEQIEIYSALKLKKYLPN